jgi:hypothetical protein
MRIAMKTKVAENCYISLWIENEVLFGLYKKDCILGLEAAKEVVALRKNLTKGVSYLSLVYITHIKVVTKEARKYLANHANEELLKLAIITNSGFSKILGNIFLTIERPKTPARLFTNKEEPFVWLKKQ